MRKRTGLGFSAIPLLFACGGDFDKSQEVIREVEGAVEIVLSALVPERGSDDWIRWSPYGEQLPLVPTEAGLETLLALGPEGTTPIAVRLMKSPESAHFDELWMDFDRDGAFSEQELQSTTPTERNHKFWSSFDAVVDIPVVDPFSAEESQNRYALGLWYVEDPRVPDEDPVLRFSRHGYMRGFATLDGVEAALLVTESVMDGIYGMDDSWALASSDSAPDILKPWYSGGMGEHLWLFDQAYSVVAVDPSGRKLVVAPFEPGITRTAEEEMNDHLKVDREAARSGRVVAFLHEFEVAEAQARQEGKPLLIDFETTWCGPCKIMDEWVYTADAVVDASKAVVAVKVDGDERLDLKERFGVSGFPTLILIGPEGEDLRRKSGYVNVADMTDFLLGREG